MQPQGFPPDVLLYLCSYLSPVDVLHLLSTCSTFHRLSDFRSLWIDILQNIRHKGSQPLACPPGEDLSQLSLLALKRIARHTIRLEKNWSQATPEIALPVRAMQCGDNDPSSFEPFAIFSVLPGTEILLLSYVRFRKLLCYDIHATTRPSPSLSFGDVRLHAQYDEPGRRLIALVDYKHNYSGHRDLHVVCVEYGPGKPCSMRQSYQTGVPATCLSVFLHADVVGVIYKHDSPAELFVLAINMQTGVSVTIPLDLRLQLEFNLIENNISCHVQDTHVGLVVRVPHHFYCVYHGDRSAFPFGNTQGNANEHFLAKFFVTIRAPASPDGTDNAFAFPFHSLSPVGFTSVYTHYPSSYSDPTITTILFQPNIPTTSTEPATQRVTITGCVAKAPASLRPMVFPTPSGRYMLLCMDRPSEMDMGHIDTGLQLVHFVPDPPSIQVRPLKMPYFIHMAEVHGIAVDDHLGVVFLSHLDHIFAIRFA